MEFMFIGKPYIRKTQVNNELAMSNKLGSLFQEDFGLSFDYTELENLSKNFVSRK